MKSMKICNKVRGKIRTLKIFAAFDKQYWEATKSKTKVWIKEYISEFLCFLEKMAKSEQL